MNNLKGQRVDKAQITTPHSQRENLTNNKEVATAQGCRHLFLVRSGC